MNTLKVSFYGLDTLNHRLTLVSHLKLKLLMMFQDSNLWHVNMTWRGTTYDIIAGGTQVPRHDKVATSVYGEPKHVFEIPVYDSIRVSNKLYSMMNKRFQLFLTFTDAVLKRQRYTGPINCVQNVVDVIRSAGYSMPKMQMNTGTLLKEMKCLMSQLNDM